MEFKKAVKTKQRLRLVIDGIAGSGKTYTALAIASGMGKRIALIDTEHGSASLYADRFEFDALDLDAFRIEDYIAAITVAEKAGYEVLIIDSTSHAWDTLLERIDNLASAKYSGNSFRAWAEGTPLYKKMVENMLSYPGHIIATCRSKIEYAVEKNDKGKAVPVKVGTGIVQRTGFEYEFSMAITMNSDHVGLVTKDRTGKYQDQFIDKPGALLGQELIQWLSDGQEPAIPMSVIIGKRKDIINEISKIMLQKNYDGVDLFSEKEKEEERVFISEAPFSEEGLCILGEKKVFLMMELARRAENAVESA